MGEPELNLAEVLTISVGRSRKETNWKQINLTWGQLVERLRNPQITDETVKEFSEMTHDQQQDIKDVGGYVGGIIEGGSRAADNVVSRDVIMWDADYGDMRIWEAWDMMVGKAAVLHSTHKHTPEHPRLRIVAPLTRPVSPLEYEAIGRKIASWMDIEAFDDTTYEPNRLMFWPSCSTDGEYVFEVLEGDWLDPDAILAEYTDWHDMREWPVSSRREKAIRKMGEKAGDPLTKPGVIGAFNRAYSITDAITTYLPDEYTPCGGNRWTYVKGSSTAGAVAYDDDTFLYSHHNTDPTSERLCNAFDLVRIHKFGELDKGADADLPDLPSMKAMKHLCAQDEKVRAELEASIRQNPSDVFGKPTDNLERFLDDLTEQGTALRLVDLYGSSLRYSSATGWLFWDGEKWELDAEAEAYMLALALVDSMYGEARTKLMQAADKNAQKQAQAELNWATKLRSNGKIANVLSMAERILYDKHPEEYDANPWDLNTPDGIIDLRTGQLREHNPDAKCTKITSCGLGSTQEGARMWNNFIRHITGGDEKFATYLQTLAGMAAVGHVYEEGMVISYGPGGNGKSTFFGVLAKVLGAYSKNTSTDVLAPASGHPDMSYVVALRGVRLTLLGEIEENARMSTSLLKRITSRDKIPGRALYKDPIEFEPTHTTIMHTNHLPRLNSLDGGTKRRIAVAPFPATLPPEDVIMDYESVLYQECSGTILQWIVDGAIRFYEAGCKLEKPENVRRATEDYLQQEDAVQQWIEECCVEVPEYQESSTELYKSFSSWARQNGLWERNQNVLGRTLTDKGYELKHTAKGGIRVGLKLRTAFED